MLGWGSPWGQSRDRRDTHSIVATQLLEHHLDGGQLGDPGSLHSFWWPVHGEGAEKELSETQASSSLCCQPGDHFHTAQNSRCCQAVEGEQQQW